MFARRLVPALLAIGLAAPALADPDATGVRVIRPAADDPIAARTAERRIADAALEVCGASPFSVAEAKAAVARSRCWHDSYARGIAQLHRAPAAVASLPPSHSRGEP